MPEKQPTPVRPDRKEPRDPLERRAQQAARDWLPTLSDSERALYVECMREVAPSGARSMDRKPDPSEEGPSRHDTIADVRAADLEAVVDARASLGTNTFLQKYAEGVHREVHDLARRFCEGRFGIFKKRGGERTADWQGRRARMWEHLRARERAGPCWVRPAPRRRGQREISELSRLVMLLDDADELDAGHALSKLEIAMLSLALGYWPSRVRFDVGDLDIREDVDRVVRAQVEAAAKALGRHARPSSQWTPSGATGPRREDLHVTKGMLVTKHCRACGGPVEESSAVCAGGPALRGAACGGREFYFAAWTRWSMPRGPKK